MKRYLPWIALVAAASIPLTPAEWREAAEEVRRSPSRMFLDLVHSVALSLKGREVEVRTGDSDVTFVLDDVRYDHEPPLALLPGLAGVDRPPLGAALGQRAIVAAQ